MTSLTGCLVDKLTFAFENAKFVNFPSNNVRFTVQVDDIRNYVIVYLFTTRGVRLKITDVLEYCGFRWMKNLVFFEAIWP